MNEIFLIRKSSLYPFLSCCILIIFLSSMKKITLVKQHFIRIHQITDNSKKSVLVQIQNLIK